MPASLLDLKRKIASVNQTGQITKAMQMVSAAKLSRDQNLQKGFTLFESTMRGALSHLMSDRIIRHLRKEDISFNQENLANLDYARVFNLGIVADLIQPRKQINNVGYLVIGGDRGLVGSYNSNIIKNMMSIFEQHQKQNIKILTVGSVPAEFFKKRNLNVVYEYSGISDVPTFNEIRPILSTVVKMYLDGVIDKLYVCHTHFINTLSSKFQMQEMFPIADLAIENNEKREESDEQDFMIRPDLDTVLKQLLPQFARTAIYGMILDAKTAEHASSMTAMSSASDNAQDIVDDLTTKLNRARQEQITTEITEIIGGANALQ